jgi:RNA polymerase-binding transcription factor DksA
MTKEELIKKRDEIQERLNKIEKDLRGNLDADLSEQSIQLENRETLEALRKVEIQELERLNAEIQKLG